LFLFQILRFALAVNLSFSAGGDCHYFPVSRQKFIRLPVSMRGFNGGLTGASPALNPPVLTGNRVMERQFQGRRQIVQTRKSFDNINPSAIMEKLWI
jgi:hypothetical protein